MMKILNSVVNGIGAFFIGIGLEITAYVIAISYLFGCYWVFDALHITNYNVQIFTVIAPFLILAVGAMWAARCGKIKIYRSKNKLK